MKANVIAKWFLQKNSGFPNGIEENFKINHLLYLANVMYYARYHELLIEDDFLYGVNGPYVWDDYKKFQNDDLQEQVDIISKNEQINWVLNVVNVSYVDFSKTEFGKELSLHNILPKTKGEKIRFEEMDERIVKKMEYLLSLHEGDTFEHSEVLYVNGNKFLYENDNLVITDEVMAYLESLKNANETYFIEMRDGELVFS
ncbi:MAG: hypothetical protein Q4D65_06510 [Peptostreptococcaceae bacterium]|nr:hypothetical protein [Peptostreptococcaceae bacterium]